MSDFTFNGISASSMGLNIERRPRQYVPRKRLTTHQIPGRSGDLHEWDGSWENFAMLYECWFKSDPVAAQAHKIKTWLSTAPVGARLEDTYDEEIYYRATYIGGANIENIHDRYGRFTVSFDCAPQACLKSGDSALTFESTGYIQNPTDFPAYPLIEFTGSVSGSIQIGSVHMQILFPDEFTEHTIRLDCALREAWELADGQEIPTNTAVVSREFPVLMPGQNSVKITGGIDTVRVYPRWWQL